jgi:uncharacterized protein
MSSTHLDRPPSITASSLPPPPSLVSFVQHHSLSVFFVLALALTWPYMIVDALGSWGLLPFRLPFVFLIPMGYGPTFAALIVSAMTEGKGSVRALLRRVLVWRVGLRWYVLVIVGSAIPTAITHGLWMFLGGELAGPPLSLGLIFQLLVSFLVFVLFNGEELGWRGYALPRLQAKRSALVASLIVGAMWALFHLPLFFDRGMADFSRMPPLSYLLLAMAWSIIFTWVFNKTRGSVLLAMLLHAASNGWRGLYRPESADFAFHVSLYIGVMCLAALTVVVVYGAAYLSRKPLADLTS